MKVNMKETKMAILQTESLIPEEKLTESTQKKKLDRIGPDLLGIPT